MDSTSLTMTIVGLLLGGSGIGGLVAVFRAKADRDSTIATGSEAAVQSLMTALTRSDKRVTELETENERLRAQIQELRNDVDTAQLAVRKLTHDLSDTKMKLDRILSEHGHHQNKSTTKEWE
jgi:chromosome segregation ATPase